MKQQLSAIEKFHIIQPHLEDNVSKIEIARLHGLDRKTIAHWLSCYQTEGLSGLKRKNRIDRGQPAYINDDLKKVIEALALKNPPISISAIHRKAIRIAQHQEWNNPSYKVVYRIIKQLNSSLKLLAHKGSKAYAQSYELIYRRESNKPNQLWQADHCLLDILLLDETGNAKKPWLTIIIDDYSRVICGYYLCFDAPCSLNTALALRQAIWRKSDKAWPICGIPDIFYTDNGSDFKSSHIEQVCIDLKIQTKFSIPGKPRGRGRIERFFLTLNQLLLVELPGYIPSGYKETKAVLPIEVFDHLFIQFVTQNYHHRLHSGFNQTPLQRWSQDAFLPRLADSLEQLDLLLLTMLGTRIVRRDGIHFKNFRYISPVLAPYVGEKITIRYDPRDLAEIRVFYGNKFICQAICQELAGEQVSLKEIIRARRKQKQELNKILESRRLLLNQYQKSVDPHQPDQITPPPINTNLSPEKKSSKKKKLKLYKND